MAQVAVSRVQLRTCRVTCHTPSESQDKHKGPASAPNRRAFLAGVALLSGVGTGRAGEAMQIKKLDQGQVEGLRRRDESAAFKCEGGMMDCDGDRRDTARDQTQNFVARQEGKGEDKTCAVAEPCGDDFLGGAVMGLNGISPKEKFERAGLDPNRPNSTSFYEEKDIFD